MTEAADPPRTIQPLFDGLSIPFEQLSADDFEQCVFGCLLAIQSHLGLIIDGQPGGSGDGGFDIYGGVADTTRKLCIQCKRQKARLGLPLLAKEIAKVAMNSRLESSDVGAHFFICTGGVTKKLPGLLRETSRSEIVNAARLAVSEAVDGELKVLRERLSDKGEEPEEVVASYVRDLDRLVVWGMSEFNAVLSPAWDAVLEVLRKFFKVSTVVLEHPRALFDRQAYQKRCSDFIAVVEPQLEEGDLPTGLVDLSAAEPIPNPQESPPEKDLLTVKSLAAIPLGETVLITAEGGAGKTTLLKLVRAEVAQQSEDSMLSVLISCSEYTPGGLDTAVHSQLGVRSGSWRMLPDKIQILCDGINEASSDMVKALFGELKPLLKSRRISCIFTSRADSRLIRAVLPVVPRARLRLLPLSPGWVRALARSVLADEFEVAAFSDAHRAMASRAAGSFMWTPFAVRAALKLWNDSRQLGNTLGDLLDAIVSERAERDLEITSPGLSSDLPRESVLAMASAMAFEMLVVNGSAACAVAEIGGTFKRAIALCPDVLGADRVDTLSFMSLLRKHDLVLQTADQYFRWGHQLVAGALAARHLASNWRRQLKSLQQPLSDDAWVFAIRHVPESELDEFLGELFQADLMLGARATAELLHAERDRSMQYIEKAIQPGQPEALQVSGYFALARVGTERAISFLREAAGDRQSDIGFAAARALAYSGDRLFLLDLLAKVDRHRQMGWVMSGGEIAIWETARFADRIAIARDRLGSVSPGEPVNESVSLVGYEASKEDISLLETHYHAANDITAWSVILRAIKSADHERAQSLFEEALSDELTDAGKAILMTAGHRLELFVDADAAFALLMDLSSDESGDSRKDVARLDLAQKVLGELPLTENIRRLVESQLPTSIGERKICLWQVATRIDSGLIALAALDSFDDDLEHVGMAANFFLAHKTLCESYTESIREAIERYLQDRSNWFTFNSWRVLVLAKEVGFTEKTLELLEKMIARIVELRELIQDGTMPEFDASEVHISQGFSMENARFRLAHLAGFVAPAAAGAGGLLSSNLLLKFLHFDMSGFGTGREIVTVYRDMPADLIDGELISVRDEWAQRFALEAVCEFGITPVRLQLLRSHLKDVYFIPAGLSTLKKAIEKCWDSSVFEMVVQTISEFEDWPQEWQHFFWDFANMIGARVIGTDGPVIERYIPLAKTDFAKRVLGIWRQMAIESRVGLCRSEVDD